LRCDFCQADVQVAYAIMADVSPDKTDRDRGKQLACVSCVPEAMRDMVGFDNFALMIVRRVSQKAEPAPSVFRFVLGFFRK
jgi:hypothetical protein